MEVERDGHRDVSERQLGVQQISRIVQRAVWSLMGEAVAQLPYVPITTVPKDTMPKTLGKTHTLIGLLVPESSNIELSDCLADRGTRQIQTLAHEFTHAYMNHRFGSMRLLRELKDEREGRHRQVDMLERAEEGVCDAVGYIVEHMMRGSAKPLADARIEMLLDAASEAIGMSNLVDWLMRQNSGRTPNETWNALLGIKTAMVRIVIPSLAVAKELGHAAEAIPRDAVCGVVESAYEGRELEMLRFYAEEFDTRDLKFFLRKSRHMAYVLTGNKKATLEDGAAAIKADAEKIRSEAVAILDAIVHKESLGMGDVGADVVEGMVGKKTGKEL